MQNRWEKGPFVWSYLPSHPRTEPAVSWSERRFLFEQRVVLLSLGQKKTRSFGNRDLSFQSHRPTIREGNPSHRGVESGSLCDTVIGSWETEEHNGASREVLSISTCRSFGVVMNPNHRLALRDPPRSKTTAAQNRRPLSPDLGNEKKRPRNLESSSSVSLPPLLPSSTGEEGEQRLSSVVSYGNATFSGSLRNKSRTSRSPRAAVALAPRASGSRSAETSVAPGARA